MALFTWNTQNIPEGIEVKQIYGICFTKEGKVLLRIEKGKYQLTGGKPEKKDANYEETLKRELLKDKEKFVDTQRKYIAKLKEQKIIE